MPNEQLLAHIRSEFARGVDRSVVTRSLLTAGWKIEDVNVAMATIDGGASRNAPPVPPVSGTPAMPVRPYVALSSPQATSIRTTIQNTASSLFIACVSLLTVVSIMGVWSIFSEEVIVKSFQTLGLLAFVAVVVIVASKFVGDPSAEAEQPIPRPGYRAIRNITLATLIASSSLLALFGVLAIWDVITDNEILNRSLSSLAIIAFSSFIIVLVCLEREQNPFWKKHAKGISGGGIVGMIILIWLFFALFSSFI